MTRRTPQSDTARSAGIDAACIILAGGQSRRMGRDKAMLDLHGRPLIRHIHGQLAPHFARMLISAQDPSAYAFLGATTVADRTAGCGPAMGIVSAMAKSNHDLYFVIACDIPHIDMDFVRAMLQQAEGFDAVIPVGDKGCEPLFAVYRRSLLPTMTKALTEGRLRVMDTVRDARIRHIDAPPLLNVNTLDDYRRLIHSPVADAQQRLRA